MITQKRRVLSNLIRRIETLLPGPGLALILNDLNYSAKASRLVCQKMPLVETAACSTIRDSQGDHDKPIWVKSNSLCVGYKTLARESMRHHVPDSRSRRYIMQRKLDSD